MTGDNAVRGWVRGAAIAGVVAIAAVLVVTTLDRVTGGTPTVSAESSPTASLTFPTAQTTGVPADWTPKQELSGEQTVWDDGATIEDLRLTNGILLIRAKNVTVRRVELVDSRIINDYGRDCFNGLRLEAVSVVRGGNDTGQPVVQSGGFVAQRLKIDGPSEGIRVSEKAIGCGPVVVEDSWIRVKPPADCVAKKVDWHGDGIQGYLGPEVIVRHSYIELAEVEGCLGTAAFFYPDQGNSEATIDNVLMAGGSYVFRLGTPGSVTGLKVLADSWVYGPTDVQDCAKVQWGTGNEIVTLAADGSLQAVSPLLCVSR